MSRCSSLPTVRASLASSLHAVSGWAKQIAQLKKHARHLVEVLTNHTQCVSGICTVCDTCEGQQHLERLEVIFPAHLRLRGFRRITCSSTAVCNSAGSGRYAFTTIVGPVPLVGKSVRSVTTAWLVVNLAVCQTVDRFRLDTDRSCSDASFRPDYHLLHLVHFLDKQYADQFHPLRQRHLHRNNPQLP